METRTMKYKELREALEKENYQFREDLKSDNQYIRKGVMIIDRFVCLGKSGKNEMLAFENDNQMSTFDL